MVVMLREPVRFVAHILQQPQRRRVPAHTQRLGVAGAVDFLFALGEGDKARRLLAEHAEDLQRGVELALAAVNQEDIGEDLLLVGWRDRVPEAPRDYLANGREIVNP